MSKVIVIICFIFSIVWVASIDSDEFDVSPTRARCDYCKIKTNGGKPNTFCKYMSSRNKPHSRCTKTYTFGLEKPDVEAVLKAHNDYRSKVALGKESNLNGKQAADMMELRYSYELALGAQLWANQCLFKHDASATCKYKWIGQNLYTNKRRGEPQDPKGNWDKPVDAWYSEVTDFTGSTDKFQFNKDIGHFSQVIWATTTHIGCGFISHKEGKWTKRFFVCSYGEGGNWRGKPIFQTGRPCSKCPKGTICKRGLCSQAKIYELEEEVPLLKNNQQSSSNATSLL